MPFIGTSNAAGSTPKPIREVTLVNEGGGIIGHKPRSMLQKSDVPHSVFVLIVTPLRQLALSKITDGKLSATAVTLCERDEDAPMAACRAILPLSLPLHHLGDQLYHCADSRAIYLSAFYGVTQLEPHQSYELLDAAALDTRITDGTPALQHVWQNYRHMLPL
jgi:hypothetical protein